MFREQAVTALTISGSVTFGIVLALLGHLKLALSRRPEQATGRVDVLLTILNLALIPLMVATGFLVDFWGIRPTMILGSVLLALAFLALSAGIEYSRTVCAVAVATFGAAAIGTASLVLMPRGLFGNREVTASLQLGLVLVALSALLMPPAVDLLVRSVGFGRTIALVAFLVLAPAFLSALPVNGFKLTERSVESLRRAGVPETVLQKLKSLKDQEYDTRTEFVAELQSRLTAEERDRFEGLMLSHAAKGALAPTGTRAALLPLLEDPAVWLAGLVFFCYAPLEAFVSVWTTTLLTSIGEAHKQVRWLAGFWGAFLLSRLAVAIIEHAGYMGDDWSSWFLFGSAALSAVVIGNLSGAFRTHHAGMGLVILGCFLGPLFPFLVGRLFSLESTRDLPGTAFGLLYGFGSLGSLALAPLVGLSAGARTIQAALRIPLFIAMVLTAATLVFILTQ
jgi:hypothetical protein